MRATHLEPDRQHGAVALELALLLPLMCVMAFAIIDFGRLLHAQLVVTNVSREGGSLASRDLKVGNDLLTALHGSSRPLDLRGDGRIFVTKVKAGALPSEPHPRIATQISSGSLAVASATAQARPFLGLSPRMHGHLMFDSGQQSADISEVTVVEVFYKFRPITPLPKFVAGLLLDDGDGLVIASRSVF